MFRSKKQRFDWTFSLYLGDFIALAFSFLLTFWTSSYFCTKHPLEANQVTILNCFFYAGVLLFFFRRAGLYHWDAFLRISSLFMRVPLAFAGGIIAFTGVRVFISAHKGLPFLPCLLLHGAFGTLLVIVIRLLVRYFDLKRVRVENIAFVGSSKRMERVLRGLRREMGCFQKVIGFFSDNASSDLSENKEHKRLGTLADLEEALVLRRITLLIIDQSELSSEEVKRAADICANVIVTLKIIPSAFDVWVNRLSIRVVEGIPLLGINDFRYDRYGNRLAKRIIDMIGALIGLILSAPIIALCAILIYRESPGPVFFRQTRLGLNGHLFKIIKLRSMRLDAEKEKGAVWAVEDDPRRLKIGEFMRRWNLDELPQFWNVLRGDMSLVGPRPERPEFVKGFRDTIRYYNLRHTCKPGMTGWAAVNGLRGNTSLEERLDYDLYYIENWSLALDFEILLMTFAPPKNAY